MKKTYLFVPLSALMVLLSSCDREYDMSNVDKTVTVGGEQFAFPLGHSTMMVVDSVLNLSGIKEIRKDDEGNYYFNYSGEVTRNISFSEFTSSLSIPSQKHSFKEHKVTPPVLSDAVIDAMDFPARLVIAGEDTCCFEYDLSQAMSEGVIRLDTIGFEDSYIRIGGRVSCPGVSGFPNFGLTARIVVPSRFAIADSRMDGDTLVCSTVLTGSAVEYDPLVFNAAGMSDCPDLRFKDSFTFKSLVLEVPDAASYKAVMGKEVSLELDITVEGGKSGGSIVPTALTGLVDKTVKPVTSRIPITGIPDYMKNATLDLLLPLLNVELVTNATLPVRVEAVMSSFVGEKQLANTSASLVTDFSHDPETTVTGRYVLANEEMEAPGYRYVFADMKSLVRQVPDNVLLEITPSTYIEDPLTDTHRVYLDAATSVNVKYDFMLPLAFGPDALMTYRDTISKIPDFVAELMSDNDVSIFGTAVSTFPLDLSLKINLLDEGGMPLGVSSSTAVIASAPERGVPSTTEYSVDLKASDRSKSMRRLEVVLGFMDGTSVILNQDDYVQISLKVSAPGGVTFENE